MLLVFCFGLGLYAVKSSIAPAIMSELFPTRLRGLEQRQSQALKKGQSGNPGGRPKEVAEVRALGASTHDHGHRDLGEDCQEQEGD